MIYKTWNIEFGTVELLMEIMNIKDDKLLTQVNKKQIYNYFIHALNYSIQDKMDSVLSEHDNINKNNHPVSIFCRTKVIIGQINQLGWNMVLLTLLNLGKIVNFAKFCSFQVINLSKISKK